MPQFRAASDSPPKHLDESEVVETLERPAVDVRRVRLTPPRTKAARLTDHAPASSTSAPAGRIPENTSEVEAQDILLESYAEPGPPSRRPRREAAYGGESHCERSLPPPNPPPVRRSSSSLPAVKAPPPRPLAPAPLRAMPTIPGLAPPPREAIPSVPQSSGPPPLPREADAIEVFTFSSIVAESQHIPVAASSLAERIDLVDLVDPEIASRLVSPSPISPITRPLLEPEPKLAFPLPHLAPTPLPSSAIALKRRTLETTPSIAPVAMSTSLALASRAADPTMQLRRPPPHSTRVVAALALVVAAVLAGSVVALVALVQGSALDNANALVDRLKGRAKDEARMPANVAAPTTSSSVPARAAEPVPSATVQAPVVSVTGAPAAVAPVSTSTLPAVPVAALPTKPETDPTLTVLTLPRSSKGHRIFVDGRVVGSGPAPMKVACGKHKVKIGSGGKPRVVDLPCGGELTLD